MEERNHLIGRVSYLVGITFNNIKLNYPYGYRELCRALNIEILPSGSNAQKSQLKQLSRYMSYKFKDSKYTIKEVRKNKCIPDYYPPKGNLLMNPPYSYSREETEQRGLFCYKNDKTKQVFVSYTSSTFVDRFYKLRYAATYRSHLSEGVSRLITDKDSRFVILMGFPTSDFPIDLEAKKNEFCWKFYKDGYNVLNKEWRGQ